MAKSTRPKPNKQLVGISEAEADGDHSNKQVAQDQDRALDAAGIHTPAPSVRSTSGRTYKKAGKAREEVKMPTPAKTPSSPSLSRNGSVSQSRASSISGSSATRPGRASAKKAIEEMRMLQRAAEAEEEDSAVLTPSRNAKGKQKELAAGTSSALAPDIDELAILEAVASDFQTKDSTASNIPEGSDNESSGEESDYDDRNSQDHRPRFKHKLSNAHRSGQNLSRKKSRLSDSAVMAQGSSNTLELSDEKSESSYSQSEALSELDSDDDISEVLPGSVTAAQNTVDRSRSRRQRHDRSPKMNWYQKSVLAMETHHPGLGLVWKELEDIPEINAAAEKPKAEQPAELKMRLLPFQLEGLAWMRAQEASPWGGGILADEMGMGKTIQSVALLVSEPRGKPSLVVAPAVAVIQWKSEIALYTQGLQVYLFHGSDREDSIEELSRYDVVITTYGLLETAYRKQEVGFRRTQGIFKQDSVLHKIQWHRIILDEAHNIKERSCNTAKAAFALKSQRKWCLSGTPLQNRVGELYSLLRFMARVYQQPTVLQHSDSTLR